MAESQYSFVGPLNCPTKAWCCKSMCWMLEGVSFLYLVPRKHLATDRRKENETLHLIHDDTMLFGWRLFSASISPSLLKNFLVQLLIPPAIVNTRGVKDACSTCSILSSYYLHFSFSYLEWAASRLWCAWLGATGSKTLISKNAVWSRHQKPKALTSILALFSVFAVWYFRVSPVSGWSMGSFSTPLQTSESNS